MNIHSRPYLSREEEQSASSDTLVLSHRPMVVGMAHKFSRYGASVDDLIQEGMMGLMMAADRFEPSKGFRFSTYARWWVMQWMRAAVIKNHSLVRPNTNVVTKRTFFKQRPHLDISLSSPIAGSDDLTLMDTLVDTSPLPDQLVEDTIDTERASAGLYAAINTLSDREQDIIKSRFLLEKTETLEEIAARYGLSKERVRQIEMAALGKLKKELAR